jgi:hypothetical protein
VLLGIYEKKHYGHKLNSTAEKCARNSRGDFWEIQKINMNKVGNNNIWKEIICLLSLYYLRSQTAYHYTTLHNITEFYSVSAFVPTSPKISQYFKASSNKIIIQIKLVGMSLIF